MIAHKPMRRLILVGGGHAHLSVLRTLAKHKPDNLEVILITVSDHLTYSGMLPGWMASHYVRSECRINLSRLVQAANARAVFSRVTEVNAGRKTVSTHTGQLFSYDLLSLDCGSEVNTSLLEAAGEKLLAVRPIDDFCAEWPRILEQAKARPDYRLVVVGGGAAAIELTLAAHHALVAAGAERTLDLVVSESGLLAEHAPGVQRRAKRQLEQSGVTVHRHDAAGTLHGVLLSDGTSIQADCVIAATGARAPHWLKSSELKLDEHGYIAVDGQHQSLSHPDVFAAGDVCSRQDVTMARSGAHAVRAGPKLAKNLLARLNDHKLVTYWPHRISLYLIACKPHYAIASWGHFSAEGSWVWRFKDWIDRRFVRKFSPGKI